MFYSKSTQGFYDEAIHGGRFIERVTIDQATGEALARWTEPNPDSKIPVDAVEITSEQHAALITGQSQGKLIQTDASGLPVLADPPAQTLADLKTAKNTEINTSRLKANRGTFSHAGKVFTCDELSRSDIDGANGMIANLGAMPPGWPGGWKAVDNTVLPIATVADWKAFYGSMFASGNANFIHAQDLKTALAAATTAAQVAAIVW